MGVFSCLYLKETETSLRPHQTLSAFSLFYHDRTPHQKDRKEERANYNYFTSLTLFLNCDVEDLHLTQLSCLSPFDSIICLLGSDSLVL